MTKHTELPDPQPCKSCRADIVWAKTFKGEQIPVNPTPTENGNLALHEQGGVLYAGLVTRAKQPAMAEAGYPLYLSHFVDCPNAKEWRRTA